MKKPFKLLITLFTLISLTSCGPKKYTIIWQNYDESVLETDKNVKKGEEPEFNGQTPIREDDESYHYEFAGWSPELTKVSEDIVYVATFTAIPYHQVRFLNYDNEVLYEAKVLEGNVPQYVGEEPTREEDDLFSYSFNGWSSELIAISEDTTYTATFLSTPIVYYHVTFLNYDGTVLYEVDVREGREAIYQGETPTKAEDDEFTYVFQSWDKDLKSILADVTTKATFKEVAKVPWGPIEWE